MRYRFFKLCIISIILPVMLAGCKGGPTPDEQTTGKIPVRVEVLEVQPEDFQETLIASGVARAKVEYRISTQVGGMLVAHHVDRGDDVKKGMALFEIDPEVFQLLVRERSANLDRADARLKFMEQERKRNELLYREGTISEGQWDQLLLDLAMARSGRDQARVSLEQAERDLRLSIIRSPIDGIMLERYREDGEVIPAGTALAMVVDTSSIVFEAGRSDLDVAFVRIGDPVTVRVDALPDRVFRGKVTLIAGNANPGTGTFPVEVTVANPEGNILPGLVGRVGLSGAIHEGRLIIPLKSVQKQLGRAAVYVVEDGKAVKKPVTPGKILGDRVVIREGLKPGDRLVVVGQGKLNSGDHVEVVQ